MKQVAFFLLLFSFVASSIDALASMDLSKEVACFKGIGELIGRSVEPLRAPRDWRRDGAQLPYTQIINTRWTNPAHDLIILPTKTPTEGMLLYTEKGIHFQRYPSDPKLWQSHSDNQRFFCVDLDLPETGPVFFNYFQILPTGTAEEMKKRNGQPFDWDNGVTSVEWYGSRQEARDGKVTACGAGENVLSRAVKQTSNELITRDTRQRFMSEAAKHLLTLPSEFERQRTAFLKAADWYSEKKRNLSELKPTISQSEYTELEADLKKFRPIEPKLGDFIETATNCMSSLKTFVSRDFRNKVEAATSKLKAFDKTGGPPGRESRDGSLVSPAR